MARKSRGSRRRERDDDYEDEAPRRGRSGGRRSSGGGGAAIIGVIAGVCILVVVVGYLVSKGGKTGELSAAERRRIKERKERLKENEKASEAEVDYKEPDPNEINISPRAKTPADKVGALLFEAKRLAKLGNLQMAEKAITMGLEIGPAYKGDLMHCRGHIQTEYAAAKDLKGGALRPYWEKKLQYYKDAKAAYQEAGAQTTYPEPVQGRVSRMATLVKMGERQMQHDVSK